MNHLTAVDPDAGVVARSLDATAQTRAGDFLSDRRQMSLVMRPHEIRGLQQRVLGHLCRPLRLQPQRGAAQKASCGRDDVGSIRINEDKGTLWYESSSLARAVIFPLGVRGTPVRMLETWSQPGIHAKQPAQRCQPIVYRVDAQNDAHDQPEWRSPASMPRWASRHWFLVGDVEVLRLMAIAGDQARQEGLSLVEHAQMWDAHYGPGQWSSNPLVWRFAAVMLDVGPPPHAASNDPASVGCTLLTGLDPVTPKQQARVCK